MSILRSAPDVAYYRDDNLDILVENGTAVVLDKRVIKYYQVKEVALTTSIRGQLLPYRSRVSAQQAWTVLGLGGVLLTFNLLCLAPTVHARRSWATVLVTVSYALVSIVVHEAAHVVALRLLGRRVDKIGFKMHFVVFPAFYVRMSQSLLTSRYEKVLVHAAGYTANLLLSTVLLAIDAAHHFASLTFALRLMLLAVAANIAPLLNSDGYRVLLALRAVNELRTRQRNVWWVKSLKIVSGAVAVWYAWGWLRTGYALITRGG